MRDSKIKNAVTHEGSISTRRGKVQQKDKLKRQKRNRQISGCIDTDKIIVCSGNIKLDTAGQKLDTGKM